MPRLDDIELESPQEVSCGVLTHAEYCALSDAVEHAEYIERVPELQGTFFAAQLHPSLVRFRRACHARENSKPFEATTWDPDDWKAGRSILTRVQDKRETGGLRRAAELEARLNKSKKDFLLTKQKEKKNAATLQRAATRATNRKWKEDRADLGKNLANALRNRLRESRHADQL